MPFIPHTDADIQHMLSAIGVDDIDGLFAEIPSALRLQKPLNLPDGLNEMQLNQLIAERAANCPKGLNFIGAGAYEHHIPAAVWAITMRGEFLTAYTPYQAEASQGSLQLIYEYQTLMTRLLGMEVSNASMYDGPNALSEAILMALRCQKSSPTRVLVAGTLHPAYHRVLDTMLTVRGVKLVTIPIDETAGTIDHDALAALASDPFAALVISQPNFFGCLESVDQLTDFAHAQGALAIAVVNPMAMSLLKPPGQWGENGVDIACGEGQPLGVMLMGGGPYFGFFTCRKKMIRQMPGRLVGKTVDTDGKAGFTLTLQAREQHIRRAKATSNICTNQGLLVVASTIYMSLLGGEGLKKTASHCHANTRLLLDTLSGIVGVEKQYTSPFFHEVVLRLNQPASDVVNQLAAQGIYAGLPLSRWYHDRPNDLLVCATETKTPEMIQRLANALQKELSK